MFKKTLIAAAVSMVATAPAFADVVIKNNTTLNPWVTTKIAKVSKQSALDFSTAVEDVELLFENGTVAQDRELRNNGFIVIEINADSGARFNAGEVAQWLTTDQPSLPGLAVSTDTGNAESIVTSTAVADLQRFFQTTVDGAYTTFVHNLDNDGRRLRIALKGDVETAVFSDALVDINLSQGNNIFRLQEAFHAPVEDVILTVGAQQNGSYTHDIINTPVVFDQTVRLFNLVQDSQGQATSLVDTFFENYRLGLNNTASNHDGYDSIDQAYDGQDTDIVGVFSINNLTSNQNIQKGQVRLTMTGDFSGFRTVVDSKGRTVLAAKDGSGVKATDWVLTSNGTARRLVDEVGTLQSPSQPSQVIESILYNFTPNDGTGTAGNTNNDKRPGYGDVQDNGAINGGNYSVVADIGQFNRTTLASEANETDSYYPFTASVADVIIVDRDGMKFDTITTGSTSSNKIFIRDISGRLGTSGGAILVTAYEYDENGEAVELSDREALTTTLPSGGAVTLTPALIADELDLDIQPNRQARFVFEVQTNQGEVAIKKSNSEGVDIKNGTRNVNQRNGDNGNIVDFTL